jgi:hypothetical protein
MSLNVASRSGVWALMLLVAAIALVVGSAPTFAHKTNLTRGVVQLDGPAVTYSLSFSPHDIAVAAGMKTDFKTPLTTEDFAPHLEELTDYITGRLEIESEQGACPLRIDTSGETLPETFLVTATALCAGPPDQLTIRFLIFVFDVDPRHRSIGRLILPAGGETEFLFDAQETEFTTAIAQPGPPPPWHARLLRLIELGIEHILLGIDHILFVLLLVVAVPRAWPVARIVTAFTVAHSVTLGLAWYGVIDPPTRFVETAIALSIAYVAVENILGVGGRWRAGIAALFGLVHGLGFYGVLSALDLQGSSAALTLAGFNIGVEIGQLAVVGAVAVPLLWGRDKAWYSRMVRVVSGAVLLIALWWAAERVGFL